MQTGCHALMRCLRRYWVEIAARMGRDPAGQHPFDPFLWTEYQLLLGSIEFRGQPMVGLSANKPQSDQSSRAVTGITDTATAVAAGASFIPEPARGTRAQNRLYDNPAGQPAV